jgi:hypothetical protein
LLLLIPAIVVLALPMALLIGYTAASAGRAVREWIRSIRLRRRANRLLSPG